MPSLGEVFADAALLVDPHDDTAVAAALDRVLVDLPLRDRLVEAGLALARRHSWAQTARRTREVLLEAAGR
jgi:glycosyltransferase involved in cell wall biosynthesis